MIQIHTLSPYVIQTEWDSSHTVPYTFHYGIGEWLEYNETTHESCGYKILNQNIDGDNTIIQVKCMPDGWTPSRIIRTDKTDLIVLQYDKQKLGNTWIRTICEDSDASFGDEVQVPRQMQKEVQQPHHRQQHHGQQHQTPYHSRQHQQPHHSQQRPPHGQVLHHRQHQQQMNPHSLYQQQYQPHHRHQQPHRSQQGLLPTPQFQHVRGLTYQQHAQENLIQLVAPQQLLQMSQELFLQQPYLQHNPLSEKQNHSYQNINQTISSNNQKKTSFQHKQHYQKKHNQQKIQHNEEH